MAIHLKSKLMVLLFLSCFGGGGNVVTFSALCKYVVMVHL